jgi:hypothetical protein
MRIGYARVLTDMAARRLFGLAADPWQKPVLGSHVAKLGICGDILREGNFREIFPAIDKLYRWFVGCNSGGIRSFT